MIACACMGVGEILIGGVVCLGIMGSATWAILKTGSVKQGISIAMATWSERGKKVRLWWQRKRACKHSKLPR